MHRYLQGRSLADLKVLGGGYQQHQAAHQAHAHEPALPFAVQLDRLLMHDLALLWVARSNVQGRSSSLASTSNYQPSTDT